MSPHNSHPDSPIPTPHINAKVGDIAKTVLMPGDPLRAKFIAETFLESPVCFNSIRGMLGYTGTYHGKKLSVMGSGMGAPSMGIYAYELFHFYDVDNIIRIGSAGAVSDDLHRGDLVLAMGVSTDSSFANQYQLPGTFAPLCSYPLLTKAVAAAESLDIPYKVGNVLSHDAFYNDQQDAFILWKKMGVLCAEMEAVALYCTAAEAGKDALCIVTIASGSAMEKALTAEERETGFTDMVKVALTLI